MFLSLPQMTSLPLVPDPYETSMVEVRQSSVPGAEEGLFARRDVVPDTVLAFYNGVRSQRKKDGPTTWQNEANAYKIFDLRYTANEGSTAAKGNVFDRGPAKQSAAAIIFQPC